jgi:hypothetical protein
MLVVEGAGARERARANELEVRRREVAVADVEGSAVAQRQAHSNQALIGERGIAVAREADRRNGVRDQGVNASQAGAETDIGLHRAAAIKAIKAVQHGRPRMGVGGVREACPINVVEAMAHFAFQAEAVRKAVAQAQVLGPVSVELKRGARGFAFERPVEAVSGVHAAIPALFSEGRRRDHGDRSQSCGALQNLLHHYPLS